MDTRDIVDILKRNEDALRARGVLHAALFGSRARRDNRADSDTDIMIEVDPEADIGVFDYVELKDYIASLIGGRIDIVNRDALKSSVAPAATGDAIYAF
jgi:predicted nucleotidyltransferase